MGRIFLFCVTCFCLFLVVPTVVHGENVGDSNGSPNGEKIGKARSVLFGNLKKLDNVLKDKTEPVDLVLQETVKSIDKTVTDLTKPTESKPVTSRIETTGNLLNKTVKNTVLTIEKTTGIVTDTVGKTSSELTNVVDDTVTSTIDELPTTPVVNPVLKDVRKTVKNTVSNIEKTTGVVTGTVGKTTSELTYVVNDTVHSAVDELPTIPVVTPVVKDISNTVMKTTSSVQTVVGNTGEFVNETLKSINGVSKDAVIKPVETVDKVIKAPHKIMKIKDEEKSIIGNGNSFDDLKEHSSDFDSVSKREPIIHLAPEIRTEELVKLVGTSEHEKHNDIVLDKGIEINMNGEVNLPVDSISVETFVGQSVVKELKVIDRTIGLSNPFVISKTNVIEKKKVDNPNLPTKSSKKRDIISAAIIMEASPTASPAFSTVGESDLFYWGIVDVFSLQSSSGRKWIHIDEDAMVLWIHAPPGKPPQQTPFLNVN